VKLYTNEIINAKAVIVATGTFLQGKIYVGNVHFNGGRFDERNASHLSRSLIEDCGIKFKKFKTTTTPRINSVSINYSKMIEQVGDKNPIPFSHFTEIKKWRKKIKQLSCWLTYTNEATHKIVGDNLHLSSINIGKSNSKSPRYCPSIEEKIDRYKEKTRHHIFVEPEGYNTNEVYLNGLYTGLPFNLQQQMINSIYGLENAKVIRYGYAIEYNYSDPIQIKKSLETKNIENLFFSGQINGTTGYEEAASQGLIAGINASFKILNKQPVVLGRHESYIGVLIDDITTKGVDEPYRMFTSRAEHRLSIRNDNADLRLMDIGKSIGLISDRMYKKFELYKNTLKLINENKTKKIPTDNDLSPWSNEKINEEISIDNIYKNYIKIQNKMINKIKKYENRKIPDNFDYNNIESLSSEARQRLFKVRPQTIGQASRIHAMKPSDIAILTVYIEKQKRANKCKLK
jgi:tRNA uridine 5-carboxymethylaminomethyl modification enzyme